MFSADEYLSNLFKKCIHTEADLTEDQREAVEFAWDNPYSALFLDVGFGKTVIILSVLRRLIWDAGYDGKILIIAPIRVATRVWPFEPGRWSHLAWMPMTLIRVEDADTRLKGAKNRTTIKRELLRDLMDSSDQIHVINQEAVPWLVNECSTRGEWPYKVVVFDESSRLRDYKTRVVQALVRVRPHIKRFHQLTATPASQTYMHLFSQTWLLDRGERFGNYITHFRENYFTYDPYKVKWKLREGAAEEIEHKIADICLVMRRKRDFQVSTRKIKLSVDLRKQYKDFERDLVLQLEDRVIDAINGAVLCGKLLQFASGFVYDKDRIGHRIHDEKIEELKSLVEETLDEPVLVSYWFKASLKALQAAFPDAAVMDREGKIEGPWNERRYKMLLVHPQSAGHGMNLQHGGHHLAVFDLFHSLELFTQLIGRLDRPGQVSTVMVHLLCASGTMDDTVSYNLQNLRDAEEGMFQRLRDLRSSL